VVIVGESELAARSCVPCSGGIPPLGAARISEYLGAVPGWQVVQHHHLEREYRFADFAQALAAANRIGKLADEQGHHPDLHVAWGRLGVRIWTHKVDGLTESDFILAAKIDRVV
jgi:4a-hydroxytetrahydrobiopterin dehydratase